jgi:nitroimidazol reductase NimA-like FMN-containing flavoprotein (pyridoxamine 5'-phosphate oxidase superfamily)
MKMNPIEVKKDVQKLLEEERIGYLCTCDSAGVPHITPMFFLYSFENHELYFITDRKTRKVSNLLEVNQLAFTVDIRDRGNPFNNRGVLLRGELVKLTDLSIELSEKSRRALQLFSEKYRGVINVKAPWENLVQTKEEEETDLIRRFQDVLGTGSIHKITYWRGPFSMRFPPDKILTPP